MMLKWKLTAATAALLTIGSVGAMAQSSPENNPSTAQRPPAVVPTTPSSEGAGAGTTGVTTPAGSAADPTTDENQQPGMSPHNPTDPASGDKAGARIPTSPAGTGSSSQ
jgi:hypothetical protein